MDLCLVSFACSMDLWPFWPCKHLCKGLGISLVHLGLISKIYDMGGLKSRIALWMPKIWIGGALNKSGDVP
jgi:hypothetical protein